MQTAAAIPRTAAPAARATSLQIITAVLLALELLPLGVLLWSGTGGTPDSLEASLPVRGSLLAAGLAALAAVIAGVLALDDPPGKRSPSAGWKWPAFVGLLLLPTVTSAAFLAGSLTRDGLHVRSWGLVLLGIADGQMAAVCCLRQAAETVPGSRFQAAALDCIRPWQRIRHVLLPACAPALAALAALTFAGTASEILLVAALRRAPGRFVLGGGITPENFLTAVYLAAGVPMVFLGLWTLRACVRALTAPFARN